MVIKKNINIVFVIAILAILISGCQTQLGKIGKTQEVKSIIIHKGTQGLELNFVQKMPPDKLREGSKFKIGLELRNKGTWKISNAKLLIAGYDESYVGITGDNSRDIKNIEAVKPQVLYNIKSFEGKSYENTEGSYELLLLDGKSKEIPPSAESYEANIIAIACYGYETDASQDVCIDPFADEPSKQFTKPCTMKDYSLSGGQGGPVGVTKIDESVLTLDNTKRVEFKIYVDNLQRGQVVNLDSYSKICSVEKEGKVSDKDLNIVHISAQLGGKDLDCYGDVEKQQKSAELKLKKDENYVFCKGTIDSSKVYTSQLVVKLRYGYVTAVNKKITFTKR